MTEQQWRYHTPERDGHAPDDWVEGLETEVLDYGDWLEVTWNPSWDAGTRYRYRPLQDATGATKRTVWKIHRPKYDGDAPCDWVDGYAYRYRHLCVREVQWIDADEPPAWLQGLEYIYDPAPLQDATYEPDLLAQCLALPQDQREALIEAMQKPQRDWADDVWFEAFWAWDPMKADGKKAAAVIRSMCRPKEELQKLIEAAEAARVLIGAKNDDLTEAAKEANINQAWHILNAAIREALS